MDKKPAGMEYNLPLGQAPAGPQLPSGEAPKVPAVETYSQAR